MLFTWKYTNFQILPGMNVHNPRIMEIEIREFIVQELPSLYNELKPGWNTWNSFSLKTQYLYLSEMSLWHLWMLRINLIFGSLQKSLLNESHHGQFISLRLIKTVSTVVYYCNYLSLLRLLTLDIFLWNFHLELYAVNITDEHKNLE